MLTFVGLGLYDERSVTVEGAAAIANADRAFAEFYTSNVVGADVADLEAYHDIDIEVRDRPGVEQDPDPILDAAETGDAVFLTAGDTMISTTHVDLRLRAEERGIDTRVIHAPTAESAASSLTGLQNYRFGKATTLPFEWAHGADGVPSSVVETIEDNRERGLHTLCYLDIKVDHPRIDGDECMTASHAAGLLAEHWNPDALGVVVARAGAPDATIRAHSLAALADEEFGEPLHLLVVPGDLHHVERDALAGLADAPDEVLN
jgi:diphthine synthase